MIICPWCIYNGVKNVLQVLNDLYRTTETAISNVWFPNSVAAVDFVGAR